MSSKIGKKVVDWVEEPPRVRTVLVRGVMRRLAFPYVLSAVQTWDGKFHSLWVFSRPAPIESHDDVLYRFPLVRENNDDSVSDSHVQPNGNVCMGSSMASESDPRAAFWNSNFKECLPHTGVQIWEALTRAAPEAILAARFLHYNFTPATGWRDHLLEGSTPWELNRRREEGASIVRSASLTPTDITRIMSG